MTYQGEKQFRKYKIGRKNISEMIRGADSSSSRCRKDKKTVKNTVLVIIK